MKICFITSQIFAWGKYGGFGSMTRLLGRELVKRGIEVCAVVPRRKGQKPIENLDGITIYGYHPGTFLFARKPYRSCNADIYHSEEPSMGTYLAGKCMPEKVHIVTSQDPRTNYDWLTEYRYFSLKQKAMFPLSYLYEKNYFVKKAVRQSDGVYCQARYIIPKTKRLYSLSKLPEFLPNPVNIPDKGFKKAEKPTVCFMARWDRRKRPELFFNLAKKFHDIKFIAMGKAHDEKYDRYLRKKYSHVPNLEMTGFIDQFTSDRLYEILGKSWIMINTAARECLPVAFLEAAAQKCAILSSNNPDGFAENFGYHVKRNDYNDGLKFLLSGNIWQKKAEEGYKHVKKTHELGVVVDKHIAVYEDILKGSK